MVLCSALAVAVFGCRGVDLRPSEMDGPDGSVRVVRSPYDAGVPDPRVEITSPADGAVFVQEALIGGEWAASVDFAVAHEGVARVEMEAEGIVLGEVVDGALTYPFFGEGTLEVSAIGYGADGMELARDSLSITVEAPLDTSCHAMLDALGLDWAPASATRGIADPVRVQPIIGGVAFRYVSRSEPTAMLMDCELGVRLHRLTEILTPYGIDEVVHIGIYNYRCIGGGDPDVDGCTPSQHAFARAIDLHAFGVAGSEPTFSTELDWVITTAGDSCPIPSSSEEDRVLKELACTMWAERIFEIVLTPNYNAAHRNHFHVDMTAGSMFLGEGVSGVDPAIGGLGH